MSRIGVSYGLLIKYKRRELEPAEKKDLLNQIQECIESSYFPSIPLENKEYLLDVHQNLKKEDGVYYFHE